MVDGSVGTVACGFHAFTVPSRRLGEHYKVACQNAPVKIVLTEKAIPRWIC